MLLANGANHNIQDEDGNTLLHITVKNKNIELTERLLKTNIDVNKKNHHENAPIHLAAKEGSVEILELLIAKNANLGIRTKKGDTALHLALDEGSKEPIEFLINQIHEHHVDMDIRNHEGQTPLHIAIIDGDEHSIKLLIEEGANFGSVTNDGDTILHLVIKNSADESEQGIMNILIKKIIKLGSEKVKSILETKNKDGKTILDLAREKNFCEMSIKELYKKYAKSEDLSLSK